jgi:ribosomal protein S12 methylthiotransferase accessory factor
MDYHTIIETYHDALPPGRLVQLPLAGMDRLGLPFWMLTFYPNDGPTNAGSGYGTSDDEALTGAFGELTEVVSCNRALARMPRVRSSFRALRAERGPRAVVDPRDLSLEAGSEWTPGTPLQWVTVRRYPSGEPVLVPIEFVACQPGDLEPGRWLITLITNGLGAGLSYEQAVGHGLLELLQRDGNGVAFRVLAGDTALALDAVRDSETLTLLAHLDAQGVDVVAKCAGSDFGIPNLYVVGADREPGAITPLAAMACGEGVHPDRELALRKALLEFIAARSRIAFSHGPLAPVERVVPPDYLPGYLARFNPEGDEPRALSAMQELASKSLAELRGLLGERVYAADHTRAFSDLPTAPERAGLRDRGAVGRYVAEQVLAAGHDILVADFSPPGGTVFAVKVIVPGLEVETMSYHRAGPRNIKRLIARDDGLAGLGDPPPGARPVLLSERGMAELGGPAWLNVAAIERLVGPLYALYREPGRHSVALRAEGRLATAHNLRP